MNEQNWGTQITQVYLVNGSKLACKSAQE